MIKHLTSIPDMAPKVFCNQDTNSRDYQRALLELMALLPVFTTDGSMHLAPTVSVISEPKKSLTTASAKAVHTFKQTQRRTGKHNGKRYAASANRR